MDLSFITEKGKFNYRVGAIIMHNNNLLMVKDEFSDYYYSVGGRVHMHETLEDAIRREVFEEVGVEMDIDRLVYIHENFFTEEHYTNEEDFGEKNKMRWHELSFYYLMKDTELLDDIHMEFKEAENLATLKWIPLEEVSDTMMYPVFFRTDIKHLPQQIKHMVTVE